MKQSNGLTLLEMVVVLGILAVLTTIAVASLKPLADQSRYEATKRQLGEVKDAVGDVSSIRQPDGSLTLMGFVADVGRLPKPADFDDGSGVLDGLAELRAPALWEAFPPGIRTGPTAAEEGDADYSDIQLPCGWRGPYLQSASSTARILDGWGQPFVTVLTTIDRQEFIEGLTWQRPEYEQTLSADWSNLLTSVSGIVVEHDGSPITENVTVVLLRPDPEQQFLAVQADEDVGGNTNSSFQFNEVPIGLRAIRATVGTGASERVVTRYIQVPPGGLTLTINLPEAVEPVIPEDSGG